MWQIFTRLYLDVSKFAPAYSSVSWVSTCVIMQKRLGSTETKGKRDIPKKSTGRKAKGIEFPCKDVSWMTTQSRLLRARSIWTFCCSIILYSCPIVAWITSHQSNLITHTFSKKNLPVESNPTQIDENVISNFNILISFHSTKRKILIYFLNATARNRCLTIINGQQRYHGVTKIMIVEKDWETFIKLSKKVIQNST